MSVAHSPQNPPKGNGIYWRGQDGQVYVKGDKGVNAAGAWDDNTTNYWSSRGFVQSIDPVAQANIAESMANLPTSYLGGGSTGGGGALAAAEARRAAEEAQQKRLAQAEVDSLYGQLSAQDQALNNRMGQIGTEYNQLTGRYDSEMSRNQSKYDEQIGSNEGTRDRNRHLAMVSAAQGGRGLTSTLGSMGALDESGRVLASRAVANSANQDIGEADRTFETNVKQLGTAWSDVEEDDRLRRTEAQNAKSAQESSARYETEQTKARLYKDLASQYGTLQNADKAAQYIGQSGNLSAQSARMAPPQPQAFQARNVDFNSGPLANYLAGQNNMAVNVQGTVDGTPQLFANTRRREREEL